MSMMNGTPASSQIIAMENMVAQRDAEIERLQCLVDEYTQLMSHMDAENAGNCKDCRKWKHRIHHGGEWHECDLDWVERYDKINDSSAAIYAEAADDTNLTTGLKTGPLFGCTMFKKGD